MDYMNAFQILAYIQKRMKSCGVKRGDKSGDTVERILDAALRALKTQGRLTEKGRPERYQEAIVFTKYGSRWFISIANIEKP